MLNLTCFYLEKNWRFELCKQIIYSENIHKGLVCSLESFHVQVEFTIAFE